MHGYDLVVVGSANADLVTVVNRRPAAGETVLGSDLVTQTLAYTATFGDISATIAIEDGIERRAFNSPTDFGVFADGTLFPGTRTPFGVFFPESLVVGGQTAPDVVGALGIT